MSDIEYEMDKYTKLITNKVYSITNLINDLKELYKTKEIILNQKSNFSEIEMNETEKEKTNYLKINDNNFSQDNNLNEKNDINEKKIEDCLLKCSNLNILEQIKDNGNGDIDATKLLIQALETKIFTKFNIMEERFKNIQMENMKVKNLTESHSNLLDELKLNIQLLKDDIDKLTNTFNTTTNKLNKKDNSLENKIKEIIEKTPNINSIIDEKIKVLEEEFSKIKIN